MNQQKNIREELRRSPLQLRFVFQITLLIVFAITGSASTRAQETISGQVKDEQGANVAAASVHLRAREGAERATTTDATGSFSFADVNNGTYLIEVKSTGFAVLTTEIEVGQGANHALLLTLKLAGINEQVVVTAAGTPQRADEISKAVSVVNSQEIESRHELTIAEALRGVPGLRVQQQGSLGELTSLRLRGQRNFDTALLLDGLRMRDAGDPNGSPFVLMADLVPMNLDRVELLRGSGSSIYGTNAIGGVINLVELTGAGSPHFEAGWEGGSLATFREHIIGSGGLGRKAGFSFALNRVDVRRGVDGNDQYGNTGGAGRLQFNPTRSITITGNFYGTSSNARLNQSPFALAGAFAGSAQFPKAIEGVSFHSDFNDPDEGRRGRLLAGSARFTQQVNRSVSYSVAYQRVDSNRRNYNGAGIDPDFASLFPFGDFEFVSLNHGITDTVDARLNATLGPSNLLTAGFEYEAESLLQRSINAFSGESETTDRQRTFAFFAQDQVFLLDGRLQLSGAVRAQSYRIRAADRPGPLNAINAEKTVVADGSIAYLIRSTNTKLRGHVGNGFRAPSLFERFGFGTFQSAGNVRFGDPTLRAEQSISADAGVDQRFSHDHVLLSATYFYTHLQRSIVFTSFAVDPLHAGRFAGYSNGRGGLARGVETSVEIAPFRGTSVRANYTYTNSDRSAVSGLQPEYVIPHHQVCVEFNQRYRSMNFSFDLNRTGSYIAPAFENDFPFRQADLRFAGFTKADVFATYERRMNERVTTVFFGGAENIFNQHYFENGFRAAGITGRGGISLRF